MKGEEPLYVLLVPQRVLVTVRIVVLGYLYRETAIRFLETAIRFLYTNTLAPRFEQLPIELPSVPRPKSGVILSFYTHTNNTNTTQHHQE